ncbi:MAG: IS630 family transposase [Pseudonocardiaceae bacterium]
MGDDSCVRDNDGRKLDHKTLEVLRMRAIEQVAAGAHPEQVAVMLGFHKNTVYGWLAKAREGGKDALKAKAVPGRPPRLSATQISRLYGFVAGVDPRQLSFDFALWTREMVREVIAREFGVKLSVVSVGRLLRTMGMSPQRPLHRAYQQDPDAVQAWKTERFPAIRAEARKAGATVYFADEAGIRSDYHAGTTWAPVGRTPVVANTGARYSINMLSAVSAQGALRFMLHDGTVNAAVFIEFCKRLLNDAPGPVFLVVDGHPSHRAKAVTTFVTSTDGRLRLFFLPGYSPQLNPDEWVWKNVKHDRIGKTGVTSKDDLKTKATGALRRLQKLPALVRGFFRDPNLTYITA